MGFGVSFSVSRAGAGREVRCAMALTVRPHAWVDATPPGNRGDGGRGEAKMGSRTPTPISRWHRRPSPNGKRVQLPQNKAGTAGGLDPSRDVRRIITDREPDGHSRETDHRVPLAAVRPGHARQPGTTQQFRALHQRTGNRPPTN